MNPFNARPVVSPFPARTHLNRRERRAIYSELRHGMKVDAVFAKLRINAPEHQRRLRELQERKAKR